MLTAESAQGFERIVRRLQTIYGNEILPELCGRLMGLVARYGVKSRVAGGVSTWDEKDAVLITYGDMVQREGESPLETLRHFCDETLAGAINSIHILPFNPASSDGGFSVIDYRRIDPALGRWHHMKLLGNRYSLMFDLVLNHCSSESVWFRNFLWGEEPGSSYFIETDPATDVSKVTRPRPWPLLTPFETIDGTRHVWTTFSADQIDMNFENPDVLFEFLDILLMYVDRGARFVRLDAVAFLWKEIGTTCIHHAFTHEIIKLMRDLMDALAPHVVILTETNVPHAENVSYFGRGDEAHMVYNFALPPLLVHGLLKNDSSTIQKWMSELEDVPEGCTFLNFTASHDGIGVRPIQDLVPRDEIDWMVEMARDRGGKVNMRTMPDGTKSPYELNITFRDMLSDGEDSRSGRRRFLCSQAIALAFKGIPAVYFHSLMGEHTWQEGMEKGENRDGNRRRWKLDELHDAISQAGTGYAYIFGIYVQMLRKRREMRAFHPDAAQELIPTGPTELAFIRRGEQTDVVLCWFNISEKATVVKKGWVEEHLGEGRYFNALTGHYLEFKNGEEHANDYSAMWLVRES